MLFILSNHINGIMVSVLTLSAVDRGFEPYLGQTTVYKIDIAVSPQSTQDSGIRAKTNWLGIWIMC